MGRNACPKLGVWDDGKLYRFHHLDGSPVLSGNDGDFVVFTVKVGKDGEEQTLACAYADGMQDLMASMYASGLQRGRREGAEAQQKEIRRSLGIKET